MEIKMNKHTHQKIIYATLLALASLTACVAWADTTINQTISFTPQNSSSGLCPGAWTGYAKMTNTTDGTLLVQPPTNAISGTLTDASGFPSPYVSIAYVKRQSDGAKWCETNSVTFPATNTTKYQLTIYVKSATPPPTNGQPMNLQVTWQTQ
jgi:hypothetical protein